MLLIVFHQYLINIQSTIHPEAHEELVAVEIDDALIAAVEWFPLLVHSDDGFDQVVACVVVILELEVELVY